MRNTTKDDIFWMLVFILSAATSVLVGCTFHHFGNAEVDDLWDYIIPFFVWMVIAFKPWAYLLDYVFRLFENKNSKNA